MPSCSGEPVERTYETNPGEVWEENEFWIDLSWRIDPDGELGIRTHFESLERPGEPIGVDEYYEHSSRTRSPACPRPRPRRVSRPLEYMRRHGAFAIPGDQHAVHERALTGAELADTERDEDGVLRVPGTAGLHDDLGATRRAHAVRSATARAVSRSTETPRVGFPTPSRKLELFSPTLAEWGWPEYATPGVHPQPRPLGGPRPRRRRAHPHPDVPPADADPHQVGQLEVAERDQPPPPAVDPSQRRRAARHRHRRPRARHDRIGHFVIESWRTEGIRPGVVACSHHMGRWRLDEQQGNERWSSGVADLEHDADRWDLRLRHGVEPFASADPDSSRVWWTDSGVHQNLTFPPQPDPVSGMHCWLQRVTITPAEPDDRAGDVHADTAGIDGRLRGVAAADPPRPRPGQPPPATVVRPPGQARRDRLRLPSDGHLEPRRS